MHQHSKRGNQRRTTSRKKKKRWDSANVNGHSPSPPLSEMKRIIETRCGDATSHRHTILSTACTCCETYSTYLGLTPCTVTHISTGHEHSEKTGTVIMLVHSPNIYNLIQYTVYVENWIINAKPSRLLETPLKTKRPMQSKQCRLWKDIIIQCWRNVRWPGNGGVSFIRTREQPKVLMYSTRWTESATVNRTPCSRVLGSVSSFGGPAGVESDSTSCCRLWHTQHSG